MTRLVRSRMWILIPILSLFSRLEAKIYDCFMFNNEFEILKIRLEELWDTVDYFVLVESPETQRGAAKPLYFQENREVFEKYLSKIIYVQAPAYFGKDDWQREHHQRNCIVYGLKECAPDDVVMISDLDEIPRASLIPSVIEQIEIPETEEKEMRRRKRKYTKKVVKADYIPSGKPLAMVFLHNLYFFQLNREPPSGTWVKDNWRGTILTTGYGLELFSPQQFRDRRDEILAVPHGGWHFTWMGGKEVWQSKINSVVEGLNWSVQGIEQQIQRFPAVPVDETFPQYIRDHQQYFKSIRYIAD